MASVYADPKLRSKRSYIAASTFSGVLYGYSTTLNPNTFVTTGALTVNGSNTALKCPQGRILREAGNRLYPDAHPGISTMMVQVYDPNSGIRGYIDPNSPTFAVYNSDKPVEIVDGGDNNNTTPHKGSPVFTSGDVIAGGDVKLGGQIHIAGGTSTAAFSATTGASVFTPGSGTFYKLVTTGPVALTCTAIPPSGTVIVLLLTGNNAVTPGAGFYNTTATTAPSSGTTVLTLISDGTALFEISRLNIATAVTGPVAN
jgi:hypothetical protein